MIDRLREVKGKTKIKLYKNISKYYDSLNIGSDEDPFAKNDQGLIKIYHEVSLLMKFLQAKPQMKKMTSNY